MLATQTPSVRIALAVSLVLVGASLRGSAGTGRLPVDKGTHFVDVMAAHDAITRGDLSAARAAAVRVRAASPAGLPEIGAPYLERTKQQAERLAGAPDLATAAAAASAMLGACGDCHRVSAARVASTPPPPPTVGQTVGHMLEHERAMTSLREGLVVPSASLWNDGAQALRSEPLPERRLPHDPKLTKEIARNEEAVHALGDDAAGAVTTDARTAVYGKVLASCANCHALHKNVWGPGH